MSKKRLSLSWWWLLLIPVTALLVPVALWLTVEVRSAANIRGHVASLRKSGQPVDYQSLMKSFSEKTSQLHTPDWMEIINPMGAVNGAGTTAGLKKYEQDILHPLSHAQRINRRIPAPGDAWPEETYFTSLSKQAAPIIERMREVTPDNQRVWLPMVVDHNPPNLAALGVLWSCDDLLSTEFEIAVHYKNMDHALELLQLSSNVYDSFDWQTTIRGEVERTANLLGRNQHLRVTLQYDLWSAEQLTALAELVGPEPALASRWRSIFVTERAFTLEAVGASSVGLVGSVRKTGTAYNAPYEYIEVLASRLWNYIRDLDSGLAVADEGYEGLMGRAKMIMQGWQRRVHNSQYWFTRKDMIDWDTARNAHSPNLENLAQVLVSLEDSRRLTQLALSIKRFQLQHERWPEKLDELALPTKDLTRLDGKAIEYLPAKDGTPVTLSVGDEHLTIR